MKKIVLILALINVSGTAHSGKIDKDTVEYKTKITKTTRTTTQPNWSASYYHKKFHGRKTASGEIFDINKMTCASNHYKLGTYLEVTNVKNGKSVVVKVNDKGPFNSKKLDLTPAAFSKIANLKQGIVNNLKVEVFNEL